MIVTDKIVAALQNNDTHNALYDYSMSEGYVGDDKQYMFEQFSDFIRDVDPAVMLLAH